MSRFVSGLDWSGDTGELSRQPGVSPGFAVAICTALVDDTSRIEERLNACRHRLGHGSRYVFHFKESDSRTQHAFFETLSGLPVSIVVNYVDRRNWSQSYLSETSGAERIRSTIIDTVKEMEVSHVDHGILMVDQRRDEKNFIGHLRKDLRIATKGMGVPRFAKVVPRPDHRDDTQLIQIADMFAGQVRRAQGQSDRNWGGITIIQA